MGRLVYVREASFDPDSICNQLLIPTQDREAEPRFGPPGGAARGGFGGPMGNPGGGAPGPYGGGGGGPGGFNPGMAGGPGGGGGGGGRQIYISNVCHIISSPPHPLWDGHMLTKCSFPTPLAGKT